MHAGARPSSPGPNLRLRFRLRLRLHPHLHLRLHLRLHLCPRPGLALTSAAGIGSKSTHHPLLTSHLRGGHRVEIVLQRGEARRVLLREKVDPRRDDLGVGEG